MAQERMIHKGQVQLNKMVALVLRAAKDGRPIDQGDQDLSEALLALTGERTSYLTIIARRASFLSSLGKL